MYRGRIACGACSTVEDNSPARIAMVPANGGAAGSAIRAAPPSMRRIMSACARAPSPINSVERPRSDSSSTSGRLTTGAATSRPFSYNAANTSPRHASTQVATRSCVPATRTSTSNPDTPINGFPSANASPCIVAIPMRRPVNEPGPVATAKMSMSASRMFAPSSSDIRSPGRRSACALGASLTCSHTTRPSRASAQLPDEVVVSRARTSTTG